MRRIAWLSIVIVVLLGLEGRRGTGAADAEFALLDTPRGTWLATVRAGVPLTVLEERDGWRRVRVEGWIAVPGPGGSPAPPAMPAASEPGPPRAAGRGATVRGALVATTAEPEMGRGSGLVVLLLGDLRRVDAEHAEEGARCKSAIAAADARLESARAEADRALGSTDNFREAATRHDRARDEVRQAEADRLERLAACRRAAVSIYQRHAVARTISDDAGRFEFEGVAPGLYRVVAAEVGTGARAWSLDCPVQGDAAVVLDPAAHTAAIDPFWGVR